LTAAWNSLLHEYSESLAKVQRAYTAGRAKRAILYLAAQQRIGHLKRTSRKRSCSISAKGRGCRSSVYANYSDPANDH